MFKIKTIAAMLCVLMLALTAVSADSIKPNSCKGPVLCNSFPIYDGCGWHFEVGLLVEQMKISNTDICTIHSDGIGTAESPFRTDDIQTLNFYLDPGLRLGVGKYFKHDDWMFNANFEWLSSRGSLSLDTSMERETSIVPLATPFWEGTDYAVEALRLQQANASLNVEYYLLDIYLSRGSYFSGNFTYEPLAGLKTSWITYNNREVYQKMDMEDPTKNLDPSISLVKVVETSFWGIGPMVGMNGNYHVCAGWSFFSMTNFSVLLGESRIKFRMGTVITEDLPGDYLCKAKIIVLCPTLRNIIGLQYDKAIFCDTQHYTVKFGFDARYYFNQYPIIEKYAYRVKVIGEEELDAYPNVCENNSFGMVGFILVFGWDF